MAHTVGNRGVSHRFIREMCHGWFHLAGVLGLFHVKPWYYSPMVDHGLAHGLLIVHGLFNYLMYSSSRGDGKDDTLCSSL